LKESLGALFCLDFLLTFLSRKKLSKNILKSVALAKSGVSIKATTNEKLGYVGNEEGVWAQAVVLLIKN